MPISFDRNVLTVFFFWSRISNLPLVGGLLGGWGWGVGGAAAGVEGWAGRLGWLGWAGAGLGWTTLTRKLVYQKTERLCPDRKK